jgi:uncharacterized phiE125 gp8 family phage protein
MAYKLYSAPAVEPVDLAEAKLHLRVDTTADNTLITSLITAAREWIEENCARALVNQTWDLYLDEFPAGEEIVLPRPPLSSVTAVYYTPDGSTQQTFAASNYTVDTVSEPGRIVLDSDAAWPGDTLIPVNGVQVRFVAGYGATGASVPRPIRQALLMLVGHYYENREAISVGKTLFDVPFGVKALLAHYREWRQ